MFTRNQRMRFQFSALVSAMFSRYVTHAADLEDPAVKAAIQAAVDAAVEKLEVKNRELLGENRKLKAKGEVSPEDHAALERERDELQGQVANLTKEVKTLKTSAETADTALKGEQAYTQRLLVDNGLSAALLEAGVKNPAHLKAAAALIRASSQVEVKVEGDNRSAVIGGKPLLEFVKAWAASDDGKHFVSAPANSGAGAQGQPGNKGAIPADPKNASLSPVDRMHAAREASQAGAAKT
jgi:hypothetical protein